MEGAALWVKKSWSGLEDKEMLDEITDCAVSGRLQGNIPEGWGLP